MKGGALNDDERLTVGEVADELGISQKTVRGLIHRGELDAFKLTPRKTVVRRSDLEGYLQSRPPAARVESRTGGG